MKRDPVTDEGGPQLQVENATGVKKVFDGKRGRTWVVCLVRKSDLETGREKQDQSIQVPTQRNGRYLTSSGSFSGLPPTRLFCTYLTQPTRFSGVGAQLNHPQ